MFYTWRNPLYHSTSVQMKSGMYKENHEDIKGVIRSRKLKGRQYNNQTKKNKRTYNDLQNTKQKT